ncbi:MAG: hypothetical protein AB8B81_01345 [Halioglobus sp.]
MSQIHPLASDTAIRQMFAMMFGDDVEINPGSPAEGDRRMIATYVNDEDEPVCACVSDYNCAAFVGSALTKIPLGGAEDAAESGDFSDMMMGNFREMMNICSRFFMDNDSPHLRLDAIYSTADAAPEEIRALADAGQWREDFAVSIPSYGTGMLSLVAT